MKKFMGIILLQAALALFPVAQHLVAAENSTGDEQIYLRLSELIEEAIEKNPEIIAAKNRWQSAVEIVEAKRSLPDPQFSYTRFIEEVETRVGPQKNIFGAKQKFPFYGKRDLRANAAAKEAGALEATYEAVKQEIIRQVKKTYYELFYLYTMIRITGDEQEILKRFERIATIKYETGKGSLQNILKVQVEITKLDDKLLTLYTQQQSTEARLNTLLDRPANNPIDRPMKPELKNFIYEKQELFQIARKLRPELKAGISLIEKSDAALRLAKKEYFPDLTIGANYILVDQGPLDFNDNGDDAYNVTFSINVPIWQKKLSSQIKSATEMIKSRKNQYQNILNRTLFEIEDTYFKIQTALETYGLYEDTLIPQAEQSLKSAEAGYITGIASFLDLLDAERILLQIQQGYWRAYTDYFKYIADMERAVGKILL